MFRAHFSGADAILYRKAAAAASLEAEGPWTPPTSPSRHRSASDEGRRAPGPRPIDLRPTAGPPIVQQARRPTTGTMVMAKYLHSTDREYSIFVGASPVL